MIQNYFKIAWRNLIGNKMFSFINILGLATGFAITLLIIQFVRYEFSYENMHKNSDDIVRLTMDYMDGETVVAQDCETNPPLGPRIHKDLSEVINYTRAYPVGEPTVNVDIGENSYVIHKLFAVDSSFFSIFSYPLIHGTTQDIFVQPNEAVITESIAEKFFNTSDAVGKIIEVPGPTGVMLLTIVGVTEDSPHNTHLKYDMLISYPTMLKDKMLQDSYGETEDNWGGNNTLTYIQLAPNTNYDNFTKSLASFNKKMLEELDAEGARNIGQKIADIHLYSNKTFETEQNGSAKSVFFLLGVAFLVIVSAFVNYVNLATSKALDRAKEVGVRKVVGSTKSQLRIQFLFESFLINCIAAVFALGLIAAVKGSFIAIAGLPEYFVMFGDLFFWLILVVFIVLGIVLSGIYPAFVLSSFKPSLVLKGSFSHSTQGIFLRKALVVFQFAVTIVLLVQIFTVNKQLDYLQTMDVGVSTDKTIIVQSPMKNEVRQNYTAFKQALLANPMIDDVASSNSVPGQISSQFSTTTGIHVKGVSDHHNYNFYITDIDSEFIPLMEMEILAGDNFTALSSDDKKEMIVNEEAIRLWEIPSAEEAIGKVIRMWGDDWIIKAVVKNYHQESAKSPFLPIIHIYSTYFDGLASVKFLTGNPRDQVTLIKDIYEASFPGTPFSYFFMDAEYDKQYKEEQQFQSVFMVLTGFSILIACLGLFGLAMFTVSKRRKEIGIRKVLGASVFNIMVLLSSNFLKIVMISVGIGLPVTYYLVTNWLENFAFRIELNWWLFAAPILLIFVLVVISISVNTINSAVSNPVHSLKEE